MNMKRSKQNYDARSYLNLMLKRLKVMKGPNYIYPFKDLDQKSFPWKLQYAHHLKKRFL